MKIRGLVVGLAAVLTLAACGDGGTTAEPPVQEEPEVAAGTTMAELSEAGTITIGTKFDQPLFGQVGPDGVPVGFDVEIGKIIAGELGIEPDDIEWEETISANREPFIENGNVDIVVATYTINDDRKQVVSFAGPYYEAGQALMVRADETEITGPDALTGRVVCSVEGSTPAEYMRENYPDVELQAVGNYSACIEPLRNGQVDAITTDNVILAGFVADEPDDFMLVGDGETFTDEPYGIGLALEDDEFRTFINDTLEAAYADGRWDNAWEATAGEVLPLPEPPAVDRY